MRTKNAAKAALIDNQVRVLSFSASTSPWLARYAKTPIITAGKEKGIAAQASSDLKKQQQMAKIQDFIKKMQGMGVIDKDKKIIDKETYKKEFSKLRNVR